MLISFAVTAKLIRVFVFAFAKSRFSHDAAHISKGRLERVCNPNYMSPWKAPLGSLAVYQY